MIRIIKKKRIRGKSKIKLIYLKSLPMIRR